MSQKLKQAFQEKEKAELYLFNLEKLREENGIEETYYDALKTEYSKMRDAAISRIDSIKADIKKILDKRSKELAVARLNYKYLEIRYKVGQIPAKDFLKQEKAPKQKIEELEKIIKQLQTLINATNSAEIGKPEQKKVVPQQKGSEKPEPKITSEVKIIEPSRLIQKQPEVAPSVANDETIANNVVAQIQNAEDASYNLVQKADESESAEIQSTIEIPKKYIPPGFTITDLEILPDRVQSGSNIGIIATIKNIGQQPFTHNVELAINDEVRDAVQISLTPGQMQELTFLVVAGLPGDYRVNIEGFEGKYTVI